jgi:hypothetical protein
MLGGLLAAGRVRDPAERRFLEERVQELGAKLRTR